MIATTDIANIIYRDCKIFGIEDLYQKGNIPEGEIKSERIIVRAKNQSEGIYWDKGFVEVNLCVPDIDGMANLVRLNELERETKRLFKEAKTGVFDGTRYRYSNAEDNYIGIEEDAGLKCHYINVRILFRVLNVK